LTHKRVPGRSEPPPLKAERRWLRRGQLAYVRIPSFTDPIHERRALQFVRTFQKAPALIVDVRGNRGGATPGRLIAALMDRPWRSWTESTVLRIGVVRAYSHLLEMAEKHQGTGLFLDPEKLAPLATYRDWDHAHVLFPPTSVPAEPGAYAGRLILLMDERCGSACEDFLVPFKDNRRATLIGTTSEGSTGQPYILDLTDGIRAYIGAKRAYFPDGSPFEGIGIRPDVEVAATRDDLLEGRDPILRTAVDQALQL
jgi:carboxyl-terminal processing protease